MSSHSFPTLFRQLTNSEPFPWQSALFARVVREGFPESADIPTGLGKTSVVVIWLIALLLHPDRVPRRLIYVVNRRTVVDQTTREVERLREKLQEHPKLNTLLNNLCAIPASPPLALSTLRGQFADNREWSLDPARPAVIVGTVDMIGSGLLFSRYTCGFKTRPHHAAFLGQDAILVHDEAHLEPAFQALLETLVKEQRRYGDPRPLKVIQLTATTRGGAGTPFGLTTEDEQNETVQKRLHATKRLRLVEITEEKQLAEKLSELALAHRESGRAVLIFARSVEVVQKVASSLKSQPHTVLTGTMRGKERELLLTTAIVKRFLPPSSTAEPTEPSHPGTCYLIATSAGEVGVNLSADDMICDLSTYESMAQRLGRLNRFGMDLNSTVEVVYPEKFKPDDLVEDARRLTLNLLRTLNGDASPHALRGLDNNARIAAFSPPPTILTTTDILLDAWAMTSIRDQLPGRPPIAAFLHGEAEWQPPETQIAWRSEVELIDRSLAEIYNPEDLLNEYPLKPHELLRDQSKRIRNEIGLLCKKVGDVTASSTPVWLLNEEGKVTILTLQRVAEKDFEDELENATLLLPPRIGGLSSAGLLDANATSPEDNLDVSEVIGPDGKLIRTRDRYPSVNEPKSQKSLEHLRVKLTIDLWANSEEPDQNGSPDERYWVWMELPSASASDSKRNNTRSISLSEHIRDVESHARNIAVKLHLSESHRKCLLIAARLHDLGKKRTLWQKGIGNLQPGVWLAKAGPDCKAGLERESYRHEFGSLVESLPDEELNSLSEDEKDLALHMVAAHHGRARPHFPHIEAFDPEAMLADILTVTEEVPSRFARLQRRYGRWGLAYLESLLRSADYAASAEIQPFEGIS